MLKSKRIVFINQDSGYLMIDIVNAYVKAGYNCVLITGRLVVRNTSLHDTVMVERITKYIRTTTFKRLYTWVIGFLQIWKKVVFKYRRDFLFIVSNPPLAPLLPLAVKNPFSLIIFDIYPDVLSELGYLSENSKIIELWRKANRKVFTKASHIFTISAGMKQVLQQYSGNKRVEVVPLWTDNTFLKPIDPAKNPFIEKHSLSDKFVVLYSGNIGLSGDVDVLVDIAKEIKIGNIIFLIIGDGAKKENIRKKIMDLNLKNVLLLPWQPITELPYSLSSASLAVISLAVGASKLAIPSKLYNLFSVGAPLLCVTPKGSEVENLVIKYDCGKSFEPSDIKGIVNFIIEVATDKEMRKTMEINSLKASNDFNSSNISKFLDTTYSEMNPLP